MPRTQAEMEAQWLAKFDEVRSPREWAEFCAGMSTDGLERAFERAMEQGFDEGEARARFVFDPLRNAVVVTIPEDENTCLGED